MSGALAARMSVAAASGVRRFRPLSASDAPINEWAMGSMSGGGARARVESIRRLRYPPRMSSEDSTGVTLRAASVEDADALARIYNQGIRGRGATFETRERTEADVRVWFGDPRYPIVVAERNGRVTALAAASVYRPRACYGGIAESSLYVAEDERGRGVGRQLLAEFIVACERAGFWKLVSRIFVENEASRRMCAAAGFREVGVYEKHARLDGRWRDVVIIERLIPANL